MDGGTLFEGSARTSVFEAVERDGLSCNQAAARFNVAISTAIHWLNRYRRTGSVAPGRMGGHRPKKLVGEYRDWLLQRCRGRLHPARAGRRAGRPGPERRLSRGLELRPRREAELQKKTLIASERDRPDVARRRQQWRAYQDRIDPARLVFIDETWTKTNMAPLRGWSPLGQRLPAKVPHGRWTTMTFLAALRASTRSWQGCRRKTLLLAQVLARSEPDRDALLEAQARPAQGGQAHPRRDLLRHRRPAAYCPPHRMRQLLLKSRICSNLESSRSSGSSVKLDAATVR